LADSAHFDYVRRLFELVMDTTRTEHRRKPPRKPPRPSIRLVTFNFANECTPSKKYDLKIIAGIQKSWAYFSPPFALNTHFENMKGVLI